MQQGAVLEDFLLKLLGDSVIAAAVIFVVILFLKHERENNKEKETMSKSFEERIGKIAEAFEERIKNIIIEVGKQDAEKQQYIVTLFSNFLTLSRDVIGSINELRMAVNKHIPIDVRTRADASKELQDEQTSRIHKRDDSSTPT